MEARIALFCWKGLFYFATVQKVQVLPLPGKLCEIICRYFRNAEPS